MAGLKEAGNTEAEAEAERLSTRKQKPVILIQNHHRTLRKQTCGGLRSPTTYGGVALTHHSLVFLFGK